MLAVNHVNHLMTFTWGMYAFYSPFCSCMSSVCWYVQSVACGNRYRLPSYPVFRKCKTLVTAYHLHRTSGNKTKNIDKYFLSTWQSSYGIRFCTNWEICVHKPRIRQTDDQLVMKDCFWNRLTHIYIWIVCLLLESYYKTQFCVIQKIF